MKDDWPMQRREVNRIPLVSVVMTVYKPDPEFFHKAVSSILRQTMKELELIIVEDASQSSGKEILADFDDPRIHYVLNPCRTSFSVQKNQGVQLARAALVAFMDADDIAHPQRLARQVEYLAKYPEIEVVGSSHGH